MSGALTRMLGRTTAFAGTIIPPTITSLEAWFNGSTLAGANNDLINPWADSSSNGFDASDVGFGGQLKTGAINGLNTVQFSSNHTLGIATTLLNGATAASFAAVFVADVDPRGTSDIGALIDGIGTSGQSSHHPYQDQVIYDGFASTSRKTVGDPAFSLASPRIVVVRSASADYTWHFDGTSFFSTGTNTVGIQGSGSGTRRLGSNAGGAEYNGQIAELCVFRSALTTIEREKMEGYFAWKWGLVANLPGGHTYKSVAP